MVTGPSDIELVQRFNDGDRHAFQQIVLRYQDRVFSLCLRWMGNEHIAEEVAQDVFIALFKALGRFRGDAQLSTWIYRVVINHCKNRRLYRKRRHVHQHESLEGDRNEDDAPVRQLACTDPGAEAEIHRSEAEKMVQEGLAALDTEQRHIIVLRDIEDLSYEEISEILGLPRGTVKSRLHRARGQLAKVLARKIRKEDVL